MDSEVQFVVLTNVWFYAERMQLSSLSTVAETIRSNSQYTPTALICLNSTFNKFGRVKSHFLSKVLHNMGPWLLLT